MKVSTGKPGRIFVIRLHDGDRMPDALEKFAEKKKLLRGLCIMVGGIASGGKIVSGPEKESIPVNPVIHALAGVHEIAAVGTIFPDSLGRPKLHMHGAFGRKKKTVAGCIRPGIRAWKLAEVVVLEITGNRAVRRRDRTTGFEMLEP